MFTIHNALSTVAYTDLITINSLFSKNSLREDITAWCEKNELKLLEPRLFSVVRSLLMDNGIYKEDLIKVVINEKDVTVYYSDYNNFNWNTTPKQEIFGAFLSEDRGITKVSDGVITFELSEPISLKNNTLYFNLQNKEASFFIDYRLLEIINNILYYEYLAEQTARVSLVLGKHLSVITSILDVIDFSLSSPITKLNTTECSPNLYSENDSITAIESVSKGSIVFSKTELNGVLFKHIKRGVYERI